MGGVMLGQVEQRCQLDMGQEVKGKMSKDWKWTCRPQLKALTVAGMGAAGVLPGVWAGSNHQVGNWRLDLTLRVMGRAWAPRRPGVWSQPG